MKKEEAIKYLRQIYPNGGHCWLDSQRIEAIDMAIAALSKPSLPSNLDEAANEYLKQYNESEFGNGGDDWDDDILITFKAGAEWMAGQFQKIDCDLVDWYSTSDGKDYCRGVKTQDDFEVPEGFYIRKK